MTQALTDYVLDATKSSNRAIAKRLGIVHTTLRDQLAAVDTPARVLVAICREYNLSLAKTFVAAGYLSEEEARTFSGPLLLASVSDMELSKEMIRRVAAGSAGPAITEPMTEQILTDVLREVEDARLEKRRPDFDLAAEEREDRTPGEHDGDEAGKNL